MLNPNQIVELRKLVHANHDLSVFHGYAISQSALSMVNPANVRQLGVASAFTGQLRGPAQIFGTPADASCLKGVQAGPQTVPAKALYVVPRARVIGNNFLLGPAGEAFSPTPITNEDGFNRMLQYNAENHQGFAAERIGGAVKAFYAANRVSVDIAQRAVFLHNLEPGNYGSFLFRQLPQMLLLRDISLDFDAYIVPDRRPWLREALKLVGLPSRPIYTNREVAGATFESIALFNEFDAEGFFSPELSRKLSALAGTVWPSMAGPNGHNLYLSRSLGTTFRPDYRVLTNEAAVEDAFRRRGFTIVYPETLSFSEQVALFRNARAIAGPSGSGMLNAVFADQGTKILDMESFHYTVRQHAKIYSSTEKSYAFLFGALESRDRPPHVAPWSVPVDLLDGAIDWALG
jgi:hypothetical protein